MSLPLSNSGSNSNLVNSDLTHNKPSYFMLLENNLSNHDSSISHLDKDYPSPTIQQSIDNFMNVDETPIVQTDEIRIVQTDETRIVQTDEIRIVQTDESPIDVGSQNEQNEQNEYQVESPRQQTPQPESPPPYISMIQHISEELSSNMQSEIILKITDHIKTQITTQISDQIKDKISKKVRNEMKDEVKYQVKEQMREEFENETFQINDDQETSSQISSQLSDQISQQISIQTSQIKTELKEEIKSKVAKDFNEIFEIQNESISNIKDVGTKILTTIEDTLDKSVDGLILLKRQVMEDIELLRRDTIDTIENIKSDTLNEIDDLRGLLKIDEYSTAAIAPDAIATHINEYFSTHPNFSGVGGVDTSIKKIQTAGEKILMKIEEKELKLDSNSYLEEKINKLENQLLQYTELLEKIALTLRIQM